MCGSIIRSHVTRSPVFSRDECAVICFSPPLGIIIGVDLPCRLPALQRLVSLLLCGLCLKDGFRDGGDFLGGGRDPIRLAHHTRLLKFRSDVDLDTMLLFQLGDVRSPASNDGGCGGSQLDFLGHLSRLEFHLAVNGTLEHVARASAGIRSSHDADRRVGGSPGNIDLSPRFVLNGTQSLSSLAIHRTNLGIFNGHFDSTVCREQGTNLSSSLCHSLSRSCQLERSGSTRDVQLASGGILQRTDGLEVRPVDEVDSVAGTQLDHVLNLTEGRVVAHGQCRGDHIGGSNND
mmetsp:Transcript_17569/g.42252  ORF Transcript_17569/g.42252 Transcript_17569/m.42252 type:complete len:290 (-) Transcript_17569:256-1125(-)